ncbi:MAG: hypothetical protein LBJ77_01245 [Holosporales bacterium]|jgi:hypothetical protein|nr:hypothetical protein [Holosporales bacterium]
MLSINQKSILKIVRSVGYGLVIGLTGLNTANSMDAFLSPRPQALKRVAQEILKIDTGIISAQQLPGPESMGQYYLRQWQNLDSSGKLTLVQSNPTIAQLVASGKAALNNAIHAATAMSEIPSETDPTAVHDSTLSWNKESEARVRYYYWHQKSSEYLLKILESVGGNTPSGLGSGSTNPPYQQHRRSNSFG